MSSHSRAVDHRAAQVQVLIGQVVVSLRLQLTNRVQGDGGGVGLQLGLEHPVLGVGVEGVGGFQLQLQALQQVVLVAIVTSRFLTQEPLVKGLY